MIAQPTLRAALVLATGIPVALLPVLFGSGLWVVWLTYLSGVLLVIGADAVVAIRPRDVSTNVDLPKVLYIGDREIMRVELRTARDPGSLEFEIVCDVSEILEPVPGCRVRVVGRSASASLELVPLRRGAGRIERIWLRWTGPMGLVMRTARHEVEGEVPIVPNIRAVRAAALRMFGSRDFLAGLKTEHYVGDGSEFESLREYVPGLDHRAIDWKASARHRQLLTREFLAERNHHVILAVDSGHLMREPLEGIPKVDHAINAALMLAYFSLRNGDRVGLYSFDDRVRAYCEPRGGVGSFARLQALSASIEYSTGETNYTLGLATLSERMRRRALIVVMTDFVDTVTAELMVDNLRRLSRHHLILFVTLQDPMLPDITVAKPSDVEDVARAVVAYDLIQERERVLSSLRRLGIHTIDALPGTISTSLINRYLEIKRRELIA